MNRFSLSDGLTLSPWWACCLIAFATASLAGPPVQGSHVKIASAPMTPVALPSAPVQPLKAIPASLSLPAAESSTGLDGRARGVIRSINEATLSARMTGFISRMPLKEGDAFAKGDVLVEFDCERQLAESKAAIASVQIQKKTLETNQELDRFASIGKNDLLISASQLDKAQAESQALESVLRHCKLLAPFDGRVVARSARAFEAVNASQPLIKVLDTTNLELDLIVPSAWLKWLEAGSAFSFRVDETEANLVGKVTRVTPNIDPVSKTVRVIGTFSPDATRRNVKVWPGMSGSASFRQAGRP
jgi:membrane fusion protein (multidrug efflux system)